MKEHTNSDKKCPSCGGENMEYIGRHSIDGYLPGKDVSFRETPMCNCGDCGEQFPCSGEVNQDNNKNINRN